MLLFLALLACQRDPATAPEEPEIYGCPPEGEGLSADWSLAEPAEIRIDTNGVRHIYARSDLDLFFASGYQQATDRLLQIDLRRRTVTGTLAAAQGEGALASDKAMRVFGFARDACGDLREVAQDSPDDYNLFVAFVSGMNRRVDEVTRGLAPLPEGYGPDGVLPEPAPFSVVDVVAMARAVQFGFSGRLETDLLFSLLELLIPQHDDIPVFQSAYPRYILVDQPEERAPTIAHPRTDRPAPSPEDTRRLLDAVAGLQRALGRIDGSNNWVVAGAHTDTGRPYLANDPHFALSDPSAAVLTHLDSRSAGGSFDVAGFSFIGLPGVQLGHNRDLVWGATVAMADQLDLWDVPVEGSVAWLGGERHAVVTVDEPIEVRQPDGSLREEPYTVRLIEGLGVFLPSEVLPVPGEMLAHGQLLLGWPGYVEASDEVLFTLGLDRATSLDEADLALLSQRTGLVNWLFASADGARYRVAGHLPDRGEVGERGQPYAILDGGDESTLWSRGWLDADDLPHLTEVEPFLGSANNDPFGHTDDNDPTNDDIYYGTWFAPGFRAERVHQYLEATLAEGPVTLQDMMDLQMDQKSLLAEAAVPLFEDALAVLQEDPIRASLVRPEVAAALARLSAWDRVTSMDSKDAALFHAAFALLSEHLLGDDLGVLYETLDSASPSTLCNTVVLTAALDNQTLLDGALPLAALDALDQALSYLEAHERGPSPTWGDLHFVRFAAESGEDTLLSAGGDSSTVNVAECGLWSGGALAATCESGTGAMMRLVTGFSADGTPEGWLNAPMMEASSTEDWRDGTYQRLWFDREDVEAATATVTTLEP